MSANILQGPNNSHISNIVELGEPVVLKSEYFPDVAAKTRALALGLSIIVGGKLDGQEGINLDSTVSAVNAPPVAVARLSRDEVTANEAAKQDPISRRVPDVKVEVSVKHEVEEEGIFGLKLVPTLIKDLFIAFGNAWSDWALPIMGTVSAFAIGVLSERRKFINREFPLASTVELSYPRDGELRTRTLIDSKLSDIFTPGGIREIEKVKKTASEGLPFLGFSRMREGQDLWDMATNHISQRFAGDILIDSLDRTGGDEQALLVGMTYERISRSKIRLVAVWPKDVVSLLEDPKTWLDATKGNNRHDGKIDSESGRHRVLTLLKFATVVAHERPDLIRQELAGDENRYYKVMENARLYRKLTMVDLNSGLEMMANMVRHFEEKEYLKEILRLSPEEERKLSTILAGSGAKEGDPSYFAVVKLPLRSLKKVPPSF